MRPRSLLALPLLLVALVAVAPVARAADPPPVTGLWRVTFAPGSVRAVGQPIPRGDGAGCESQCQASYQFGEGIDAGETTTFFLRLDASGCAAVPCDIAVRPPFSDRDGGFEGTLRYDGTTFTGTGQGTYQHGCGGTPPDGTDTLSFRVAGPPEAPTFTGEMTAVYAVVGTGEGEDGCSTLTGYEIYTGTITGTRTAASNPSAGALPVNGSGSSTLVASRRTADERAALDHTRPVLSTRVATARDLPWRPSSVLVSALLALLLVALMPFPAALFNNTLEANYAEVRGWFSFLRRAPTEVPGPERRRRDFAVLVGAVALLGSFLDPGLGLDRASLLLVAGLALSAAVVNLVAVVPASTYLRRRYGERAHVALYPLGLGLAAFCVLVSRVTGFEPGYLYGVVAGFAFARELGRGEKGRLSVGTAAFLLAVAGVAFGLRIPVHDAVVDGGGWPLALLDTVLAALFAAGVEANVIGLLPIRFMPGDNVFAWSKVAWGALFGLSVFAFLHALSAAAGGASTTASVATAAALFGAFGTVSVTFWAYFRLRRQEPAPAVTGE